LRRPGQVSAANAEPGPIRRGLSFEQDGGHLPQPQKPVVMGPCVRRDDAWYGAFALQCQSGLSGGAALMSACGHV
jgi:hypothetical protein